MQTFSSIIIKASPCPFFVKILEVFILDILSGVGLIFISDKWERWLEIFHITPNYTKVLESNVHDTCSSALPIGLIGCKNVWWKYKYLNHFFKWMF